MEEVGLEKMMAEQTEEEKTEPSLTIKTKVTMVDEYCQTDLLRKGSKRQGSYFILPMFEERTPTIGGWKEIALRKTGPVEKCIWGFFLLTASITALVLVYRAIKDFSSHTVTTNMDSLSTSFEKIHFPAITVCNMNNMKLSVLKKYNIGEDPHVLDVFDRFHNVGMKWNFTEKEIKAYESVKNKIHIGRLKTEGQHKCHNMFIRYYWKNEYLDFNSGIESSMHYAQNTDENLCCQIFPGMLQSENDLYNSSDYEFWSKNDNPWEILFNGYKTGIKSGKQGVQVLIDVETFEYFSSHSLGSEGIMVLIQHYRDIPLMRRESFTLSPGQVVDVGLSVTEITTTQNAISRFNPTERDCFTAEEVNLVSLPLSKGYRMSMKNCLYDKALHAVKERCGCQPPFYVLKAMGNLTTCTGTALYCALRIFDDISDPVYINAGTEKKCRSPCDDVIYDSRITSASYPNDKLFRHRPEVCQIAVKLIKICTGWLDPYAFEEYGQYPDELKIKKSPLLESGFPNICDNLKGLLVNDSCSKITEVLENRPEAMKDITAYAKRNLLWLNVYVKDSHITRIVRDERMTRTNFVANVGGLLGLCMGFSLVSVAEIVYFLIKKRCLKCVKSMSLRKTL